MELRNCDIKLKTYLDYGYRIEGTPQMTMEVWADGKLVYDKHGDVKHISDEQADKLKKIGFNKGAYNRQLNFANIWEYDMTYRLDETV